MIDSFAFSGCGDIYVTHHVPTCPVVEYPHLGSTTDLEREYCRCGAFKGSYSRDHISYTNIVTTAGAVFYMQQITNGAYTSATPTVAAVTNDFSTLEMAKDSTSAAPAIGNDRSDMSDILAGTQALPTSGYPRVDDTGDADNTGDGPSVLTWTFTYSAASFNETTISDMWITIASPGASSPIATHFDETSFTPSGTFGKTTSDTLKVIYNVTGAGA